MRLTSVLRLSVFVGFILCNCNDIEPWTVNSTGEYYLFHSRPTDITIRNLTCHQETCIIQCNEEESCQKFNIHGSHAQTINLECNYPEMKELRPGSCWKANIFAQNATDLNVYCTNENCAETRFYCTNENSYFIFNGDWAAKFASIFGLNLKHNLSIICNDTESCSDITIHCPLRSECHIHCNGTKACFNANIFITNEWSFLHLDCDYADHTACDALTIHCDDLSNDLWFDSIDSTWKCFYDSTCCPFQRKQNHIQCEDSAECVIDCDDEHSQCNWAIIDATNASSLALTCTKRDQCKLTTVYCPQGDETSCSVHCVGKDACQYMNISSDLLSSMNIQCKSRSSCQYMSLHVTVDKYVNIECGNEWSCANAVFDISASRQSRPSSRMLMECNGRYSCEGVALHCPYPSKHSCVMQCSDHDSSCGGVQVFAVEPYEDHYLKIQCPMHSTSTLQPCNFVKVSCAVKSVSTVLRYLNGEWKCSNDRCCPWKPVSENPIVLDKDNQEVVYGTMQYMIAIFCGLLTIYAVTVILK